MKDLGSTLLAVVEREPGALAIVDGEKRLTYEQWLTRILRCVSGLAECGLKPGDHLLTALQNRSELATLHWACQLAGIIITPVNWRVKAEELAFYVENAEARAVAFEPVTAEAVAGCEAANAVPTIAIGEADGGAFKFAVFEDLAPAAATPQVGDDATSLMFYTSGTTGRPKGVPRTHRAERIAALAHVAQNQYGPHERTLGVMPLYHTMGVRSLLSMALINGTFVCLPAYSPQLALNLIEAEGISNLYLVPTLYHALLEHPDFAPDRVRSVRKLGFAGAAMTDDLLLRLNAAFRPELFVNHYGSSEIYTFTVEPDAVGRPGSAGRAGINQQIRVVGFDATSASEMAGAGEEGQIIASLNNDEAFQGYWRRPDADEASLRDGWYFTGDTGYRDADGNLFVTGRVDDMIITGGENVSPGEIESALSLHPAVEEVAVVGRPDTKWGEIVTAYVKCRSEVTPEDLDRHCRESSLADFKRPRAYEFVAEIPKSPVGKILRRLLKSDSS